MLWLALLGWFGVRNARAYSRVVDLQEALVSLTAVTVMTREFRVADADMTIRQFADKYLHEESNLIVYYAASDGRYRGIVSIEELHLIDRSQWDQSLYRVVHPLTEIPTVQETTPLTQVIDVLESQSLGRVTVLSPAGSVAGVIDRGDVVRAVAERLNVPIQRQSFARLRKKGHIHRDYSFRRSLKLRLNEGRVPGTETVLRDWQKQQFLGRYQFNT